MGTAGDDFQGCHHRAPHVGEGQGTPAPPVIAFEQDGTFVRAWGGSADGFDWPANEHGIHVDPDGNVWIGGNSAAPESDDMLLQFTAEGELLLQIGGRARSSGNDDTVNPMRPAESFVHGGEVSHLATDSDGNLYTAEAQRGRRAQKLTYTGMAAQ